MPDAETALDQIAGRFNDTIKTTLIQGCECARLASSDAPSNPPRCSVKRGRHRVERFAVEGCDGLLRDKTRPSRNAPLGPEIRERVLALTLADTPDGRTHRTADMMATAVDNAVAAFFAKLSK